MPVLDNYETVDLLLEGERRQRGGGLEKHSSRED